MTDLLAPLPTWVAPGDAAWLVWYEAVVTGPDGLRCYQIAGPLFDKPPASPFFLLAPVEESHVGQRLYAGEAGLDEARRFLGTCLLAEGRMAPTLETLVTRAEAPALAVLDAWRAVPARPVVPYCADINAFLPRDLPVYVSEAAHAAAQRAPEAFQRASVCAECGDPEDASVFLWTVHRKSRVRVVLLIENEGGRWACHLHPFEFERTDD